MNILKSWRRPAPAAPAPAGQENDYGRQLSTAERARGQHQEFVGGMWEEMGALQFDFLKKMGLQPRHRLIDIGCGCLRGGIHFVPYLEARCYYGIDLNQSLIEAGRDEVARTPGAANKEPDLRVTDQFDLVQFGVKFDYALAVSVFTHLYSNHIARCLSEVKKTLAPGGKFYATFFEAPRPVHLNTITHTPGGVISHYDCDPFHYSFAEMEALAEWTGLKVSLIGEWGHPRDQRMLRFTAS